MYVLAPIAVTDTVLTASSLTENDHPVWSTVTPYSQGTRVIVINTTLPKLTTEKWTAGQIVYWNPTLSVVTTSPFGTNRIGRAAADVAAATATGSVAVHAIYEAVTSTTGNNPVGDDGTKWVRVSSTNKWKPFDFTVSAPARASAPISFTFTLPQLCTGLALFRLVGTSVAVEVRNLADAVVFTETQGLIDTTSIADWFQFFMWTGEAASEALFTGLPGYPGYKVTVTVNGSETQVGEVVLGDLIRLGTTIAGTEVSFQDFSRKDRDDYGNVTLIERDYSDATTFNFTLPPGDLARVNRVVRDLRATPAVWLAHPEALGLGAVLYGFPSGGLRVPLSSEAYLYASLEIEGLT